ncbi:MAG: hypothetical protein NPIRA04_25740 [Nitrospirales bacterium]|nr:MAG: hypothetical protein NPIRA04_25740 [Nitrospirales bacterium]
MPTRVLLAIAMAILNFTTSPTIVTCAASDTITSHALIFSRSDQTLTAHIDRIALRDVLQVLANRLWITITLFAFEGSTRLSTRFTALPVEQGIERLLHGQDYALLYSGIQASHSTHLKEIIVLPRSHSSTHSPPTETEVTMFPMQHQQPELTTLVETAETLVQLVDQKPPSSPSLLPKTINSQDSEIRSTINALLKKLESSSE